EFHILGHQFTPVDGWFVVPLNALTQIEYIRGVVYCFPAFSQIGLDAEGTRLYIPADFVPQELAVHKAQHGMRPAVAGEMGIEVHGIPPAHAQEPPALGRPCFSTPERGRARERPGRQRCTSREARLQQGATTQTMGMSRTRVLWLHKYSSLKGPISSALVSRLSVGSMGYGAGECKMRSRL